VHIYDTVTCTSADVTTGSAAYGATANSGSASTNSTARPNSGAGISAEDQSTK
jgi:hypothetical protein